MDPDRMLAEIPNHVLLEWIEYYGLEPWDVPIQFWPAYAGRSANTPEPAAERVPTPEEQLNAMLRSMPGIIDLRPAAMRS